MFTRNYQAGVAVLRRLSVNKQVLFILLLLTGINVSVRVLRGYINPHDMMQDLIGAGRLFTSETIYPKDLQHIAEDELRRQEFPHC
jgi:hypothetical protein